MDERRQLTIGLDAWLARHGPLAASAALVVALEICARVSRMTRAELAAVAGSIAAAGVARSECGGWTWIPAAAGVPARAVGDAEVIGRLGALLFHALTGQRLADAFASEQTIRASLRRRPDLSAPAAEVTVSALLAGRGSGQTLDAFARDVRRAIGVEREPRARTLRGVVFVAALAVLVPVVALAWRFGLAGEDELEAHGLSGPDTAVVDIIEESAQTFALIEEHTAAIQEYQALTQFMNERMALDDPRVVWIESAEAWVRTLGGDPLTTEQMLGTTAGWLAGALGERHPYARAARLGLAATLEARGASAEATALRQEAARATRTLFDGTALGPDLLEDLPAPPGVVAHMAPNEAVREGFRQRRDGSFFTPLTSIQRWLAARNGWRLHVVATAPCRASVVVGDDARHVRVHASRAADGGWEVGIEGTAPPMTLRLAAAEKVGVSVVADAAGGVRARAGDAERTSVVDVAAAPPQPPYGLHFSEGPGPGGCQVVWLEIPFPWDAAVARAWVLDPGPLASR